VLIGTGLAAAGCGQAASGRSPEVAAVPLAGGARIVAQIRRCDRGAIALRHGHRDRRHEERRAESDDYGRPSHVGASRHSEIRFRAGERSRTPRLSAPARSGSGFSAALGESFLCGAEAVGLEVPLLPLRALDQRAKTILKVATEIVRQQDAFFANCVQHLRPLNLKTIADAIGMHESTVSRVTANKYVATNRGSFELKYFFTASIASADGGEAHSAEAVRHHIRQLIDAENPAVILSDDTLVERLRETGIDI